MAFGLQVYNSSGILQIDQDYQNYFLLRKTSLTVTGTASITDKRANKNFTAYTRLRTDSIIAIRCNTTGAWVYYYEQISNYPNVLCFQAVGVSGTVSFDVFEFGKLTSYATSGYGLQVFTATGECVFDSTQKPMRVKNKIVLDGNDLSANYSYNSNYAIVICSGGYALSVVGGPNPSGGFIYTVTVVAAAVKKVDASTISAGTTIVSSSTSAGGSAVNTGGGTCRFYGFIVDVTNY